MSQVNPLTAQYAYTVDPPANLYNQTFPIVDQYGNVYLFTLGDLVAYIHNGVVPSIVFAVQIGAAAITLIILVMITKREKRRMPVFILNTLSLVLTIIFGILACLYYTSAWYNPYSVLTGDFSMVSNSDKATSIIDALTTFLLQLSIESSLLLQIHVVCVTLDRTKRIAVMFVCVLVALVSIGFRFAQTVDKIQQNVIQMSYSYNSTWLVQARNISLTISICLFSAIFSAKLGWSLYQRHRLGLTRFGPMQIILIGGTQTLIIPAFFAILQSIYPTSSIVSMVLGITAISLPLTSLWASSTINNASPNASPNANNANANVNNVNKIGPNNKNNYNESSATTAAAKLFPGTTTTTLTDMSTCCSSSEGSFSVSPIEDVFCKVETDMEMQALSPARGHGHGHGRATGL